LIRILRFCGHTVIGDNHLGDWGTQFGILIHGYKNYLDRAAFDTDPVRELARLYVHVRNLAKAGDDEEETAGGEIMAACRAETAKLHAGDPENVALWKLFMPHCMDEIHSVYKRLGILPFDNILGESFYQPMLANIVKELLEKKLAFESGGAVIVPNAKGIIPKTDDELQKEEPPALIRKRDGAFTYTTTDLATIQYRVKTWKPDALLYVIDSRQAMHCRTLFANARRWGYESLELQHLSFGSVLDPVTKKPISTRAGGGTELHTLISRAVELGIEKYKESHAERKAAGHELPDLTPEMEREIAEVVGIGAMKYADLGQNRTSDYVFDFNKMLATDGNTAAYMQYAYARCRSIVRKSDSNENTEIATMVPIQIANSAERALVVQLLKLSEAIQAATAEYMPHHLTTYLWDLAKTFSTFFVECPVLKAETPELRASRLVLVDLVGRVIRQVLELLGIRTVERM
jgi:arginyl-tRNA synthetase